MKEFKYRCNDCGYTEDMGEFLVYYDSTDLQWLVDITLKCPKCDSTDIEEIYPNIELD